MTTLPPRKRILLAIGDVGGGHRSAAAALTRAVEERYAAYEVVTEDFFAFVDPSPLGDSNRAQRLFARHAWLKVLVNDPVWHLSNTRAGNRWTERFVVHRTLDAYAAAIERQAADLVVSIHPYVGMTLSALKRSGAGFRYAVVVTDLASLLRGWADPEAELVVSPTDVASAALRRYGVQASRIVAPLFPLAPALRHVAPPHETLGRLGLDPGVPTILLSGGGNGARALTEPLAALARDGRRQVIVACGKDASLREALERRYGGHAHVRVLGFTPRLTDHFAAADVVVTKPGPATILELDVLGKKVVLLDDLGPQEAGNARYALARPGVRHVGRRLRRLPGVLEELLAWSDPGLPSRRRSDEASIIAARLVGLLDGPEGADDGRSRGFATSGAAAAG